MSGPNRSHRSQSVFTKFGKYAETQRYPYPMEVGVWSQTIPSVPICLREVRKICPNTRVSELHGCWVSGPNRSNRSQAVHTEFGKYSTQQKVSELHEGLVLGPNRSHRSQSVLAKSEKMQKQRYPNFMGGGCLVPIGSIGPNLSPRSS